MAWRTESVGPCVYGWPLTEEAPWLGRCLVRPVWRYSTIPGWEEWRLAEELRAIAGVTAQLWPHTDAYDLLVEVAARRWKRQVDLKDYTDPGRLAAPPDWEGRPRARQHVTLADAAVLAT